MDHIPLPPNPTYSLPEVPYLGGTYHKWDFQRYPELEGWKIVSTLRSSFLVRDNGYSDAELAEFIQEWLFFGLLVEVLGIYSIEVDVEEDFLHREGDRTTVTTAKLESYLDQMMLVDLHSPHQERLTRVIRSSMIFDTARRFAVAIVSANPTNQRSFPPEVALSIIVLGATLQGAVQFLAKDVMPLEFDKMHPDVAISLLGFETMPSAFIREKLTQMRWCKSDVQQVEALLDIRNLIYLTMLQRPAMRTNHEECSTDICVAHSIDDMSYETKHVSSDCHCSFVGPDSTAIAEIYTTKGVPVIKISQGGSDQPVSFEVVDAVAANECYIAVSHVWSDGLGNPRSNALPECQIKRLVEMAESLEGNSSRHCLWMDTLCVPLDKQARKQAIASMADIYRQAEHVMVLDAELQHVPSGAESCQIMLQVGMCTWGKRLWTLQEGAFAKNLHFRLSDGFVNSVTLQMIEEIRVMLNPHLWRPSIRLREFYNNRAPSDYSQFSPLRADAHPIIRWSMSLWFRATSKQMDETVCLASLVGLDVRRLLQHDTLDERVREFLRMVGDIPAPILFQEGERGRLEGFRWAPRSLLGFASSLGATLTRGENYTQMGLLNPQHTGLRVAFPGFIISVHQGMTLQPDASVARFYAWIDGCDDGNDPILLRFKSEEERNELLAHAELALVLEQAVSEMPNAFLGIPRSQDDREDEVDEIDVEYWIPVTVASHTDISNAIQALVGKNGVRLASDPFPHVGVWTEELLSDQAWCVT